MIDLAPLVAAGILTIEQNVWIYAGLKEQEIREVFDVTAVRYYQHLNVLLDTELALIIDPITTLRLRRIRETRRLAG